MRPCSNRFQRQPARSPWNSSLLTNGTWPCSAGPSALPASLRLDRHTARRRLSDGAQRVGGRGGRRGRALGVPGGPQARGPIRGAAEARVPRGVQPAAPARLPAVRRSRAHPQPAQGPPPQRLRPRRLRVHQLPLLPPVHGGAQASLRPLRQVVLRALPGEPLRAGRGPHARGGTLEVPAVPGPLQLLRDQLPPLQPRAGAHRVAGARGAQSRLQFGAPLRRAATHAQQHGAAKLLAGKPALPMLCAC